MRKNGFEINFIREIELAQIRMKGSSLKITIGRVKVNKEVTNSSYSSGSGQRRKGIFEYISISSISIVSSGYIVEVIRSHKVSESFEFIIQSVWGAAFE
jgi:methionine salvage enolase-phosphatase E1